MTKEPDSIGLDTARRIVDSALAHARSSDYPPMTVSVHSASGRLVAFASEDGSSLLRERIATAKARGALNMGAGSRNLAAKAANHPAFVNSLIALAEGDLVPVPGGVLVRDGQGRLLGAVGVSGHLPDDDEACAIHGIAAVALHADPGA